MWDVDNNIIWAPEALLPNGQLLERISLRIKIRAKWKNNGIYHMNIVGQGGSLNNNRRWCVVARMIFRSGSDGMYCQRVTRRFPPTNLLIGIKLLLSCYCAGRQVPATNSHHYSSVTRAARQYLAAIISRLHCHDLPQFWCHARIGWVLCKVKTFNR